MVDDRTETTDFQELENRRQSRKLSRDYAVDQVDINDPSIEKFPSEKTSVFDSLRKIQSSLTADSISIDEPPTFSQLEFRRPSIDSSEDGATSTGSMSPTSPTSLRKRESRVSHSSFGKTKSAVSLTSIAEEPKNGTRAKPRMPASSHLKQDSSCSASDGEDSIAMKSNKTTIESSTQAMRTHGVKG
jgi:ATP-dependent RNA helicase MRH4